jgi:hypothetical protein
VVDDEDDDYDDDDDDSIYKGKHQGSPSRSLMYESRAVRSASSDTM